MPKEIKTKRHSPYFARSLANLPDCYSRESRKRQKAHDTAVASALRRRDDLAAGRSMEETVEDQIAEMRRACGKDIKLMGVRLDGFVIARIDEVEFGRARLDVVKLLRAAGFKFQPWIGESGKTIRGWSKNNLNAPDKGKDDETKAGTSPKADAGKSDLGVRGNAPVLRDGGFCEALGDGE